MPDHGVLSVERHLEERPARARRLSRARPGDGGPPRPGGRGGARAVRRGVDDVRLHRLQRRHRHGRRGDARLGRAAGPGRERRVDSVVHGIHRLVSSERTAATRETDWTRPEYAGEASTEDSAGRGRRTSRASRVARPPAVAGTDRRWGTHGHVSPACRWCTARGASRPTERRGLQGGRRGAAHAGGASVRRGAEPAQEHRAIPRGIGLAATVWASSGSHARRAGRTRPGRPGGRPPGSPARRTGSAE